jgi:hypothetical protein
MFRLQRRAVAFTRIRDEGGQKSLTFEVNTALRIHSPIRRPSSPLVAVPRPSTMHLVTPWDRYTVVYVYTGRKLIIAT